MVDLVAAVDQACAAAQSTVDFYGRLGRQIVSLEWQTSPERIPLSGLVDPAFGHGLKDGDWIESKDQTPRIAGAVRLLQLADLGVGEFLDRSDRWITPETFGRLRCSAVLPGDLLISRMAEPAGRTARVPSRDYGMVTAVDCSILRLDARTADPDYWLAMLNSREWLSDVDRLATGSTRRRITRRNLERLPVPLVAVERQARVGAVLAAVAGAATAARKVAAHLMTLKATLVCGLLSGEHEIPISYDRFLDPAA